MGLFLYITIIFNCVRPKQGLFNDKNIYIHTAVWNTGETGNIYSSIQVFFGKSALATTHQRDIIFHAF